MEHLELERCSALGYVHSLLPEGCKRDKAKELIAGMLGWNLRSVTVNQELSFLAGFEAALQVSLDWPEMFQPQPN